MDWYIWVKALHVMAVIAWMAGLLYLPRLFVYHAGVAAGSATSETFKVMERKLLRLIMTPAMGLVWLTGLAMAAQWVSDGSFKHAGWLHAKLALVLLMSGAHEFYAGCVRRFADDANRRSDRFYRVVNEVPALIMVGIVVLVIVKPF